MKVMGNILLWRNKGSLHMQND